MGEAVVRAGDISACEPGYYSAIDTLNFVGGFTLPVPWKLIELTRDEVREIESRLLSAKRLKFLVDENLGPHTAEYLRDAGYKAEFAPDVGLGGRDDAELLQYAWRKKRVLLTHDTDFLDDRKFPEHRNPGVIILPGGAGNDDELGDALEQMIYLMGKEPERFVGRKIHFTHSDAFRVHRRNPQTGKKEEVRYRIDGDDMLIWEDDTLG